MKSGGPWNLRGLRPDTRDAARDAARRSGISVGEWLNNVIQKRDDDYVEPMRFAEYDSEDNDGWRDDRHHEDRHDHRDDYRDRPRSEYREPRREGGSRRRERELERGTAFKRDDTGRGRDYGHESTPERGGGSRRRERKYEQEAAVEREAVLAREEFSEVNARLDRLTNQLDRMAHSAPVRPVGSAAHLTGAPVPPARGWTQPAAPPRPGNRPPALSGNVTVDDAIAAITQRQRALYGEDVAVAPPEPATPAVQAAPATPAVNAPAAAPPSFAAPSAPERAEPRVDLSNLQEQLQYITTRIESLRPSSDFDKITSVLRKDLAEISRQLTEALPRRAIESLEIEIQALTKRLDHSRESGVDLGLLSGLEQGVAEIRDSLRGLTPAENLVGFDDAVRSLSQKVDLILAKEDPGALQQLETAIGALRGIVSHVASNDTLTKVAEDVRELAGKVDGVANSAASGHAVLALEGRIDTLANALSASAEAGHAVPRELEKLLSGLIEKLEWVQLTHTDHAALGHLEDRIVQLIKRLDASDARLGNLEAVERGLADLLVHIDQVRNDGGAGSGAERGLRVKPQTADTIEREVAEIKRSERRTRDSLEAVHGTVEQVVDRLAMIESDIHEVSSRPEPVSGANSAEPAAAPDPIPAPEPEPISAAADPAAPPATAQQRGTSRKPIDPNLPPDHPLEPGSAAGSRDTPSAADRIAASEAAIGYAKPPVIAEPEEKPNFIAAARRAAQAAAAAPPERATRADRAAARGNAAETPSRKRKLIMAVAAVLILAGGMRIALHMFQDNGPGVASQPAEEASSPAVVPQTDLSREPPQSGPLVLPVPSAAPETTPVTPPEKPQSAVPSAPATTSPEVVPPAVPGRQSALHDPFDITGTLPRRPVSPPPSAAPAATAIIAPATAPGAIAEKLPATIGGPVLRAAAMAGDAAAEFEIATRFADGHGAPTNNEQALHWLELAAKQGLAPAEFRLGGYYEKGIGVKKDLGTARDLYTAAAAKGNGKAMHNLAVLYAEGVNGPADYRTAAQWFRKAAEHGVTDSQYNLAILYARGVGVEQNYAEAYKWFTLGANAGDNEAAKKRDEIAARLDPQSLAAAEAAVQKWKPVPQPDDAINVKAPPGGWDPSPQAAKPRPHQAGGKPPAPEAKL